MQKRKLISMLIALFVSLGLWAYVVTVENPEGVETIHNVPVIFSGEEVLREDYKLLIMDSSVPTVSLTFAGRRADLKKLTEHKSELAVNIDVTQIRSAREYSFQYTASDISIPPSVSSVVSISDLEPNMITISVGRLVTIPVPVKVLANVATAPDFNAELPTKNYDEISITGPEELVSKVKYALVNLDRENVDQTIVTKLPYTLIDENSEPVESEEITSAVTEIEVTLPVYKYKDVPLEIGLIDGGGATSADTTTEIKPSTIRLAGEASVLDGVSSIKLSNIDLAGMMSNSETMTRTIPIPEGCKNLSGEVEASVEVNIKNKDIRQIRVSNANFQFINTPLDVNPESRTTVLLVTVRANRSDINKITEENLRVVADLSGITRPENGASITVPVTIYVDGFEGAGVVGTDYTIVADLVPVVES